MAIAFTSKEETTASFLAEILFETVNDEVERTIHGTVPTVDEEGTEGSREVDFTFTEIGHSELTVTYKMNDEEVKTFYPKKTCINGKHILTLFLPITQVIANSENTLAVYLKMTGGTLTSENPKSVQPSTDRDLWQVSVIGMAVSVYPRPSTVFRLHKLPLVTMPLRIPRLWYSQGLFFVRLRRP